MRLGVIRAAALLLGGVIIACLLAAWLIPPLLDWNRYRTDIADLVSANLGRAVAIEGPISLSLLPEPVLTAERITVAAAHDGVTMAVAEMRVRLALMPLLSGRVDARELVLRGLDMRLPWPLQQDRLVLQTPTWLSSISARVESGRLSVGSVTMTAVDATLSLLPETGSIALAGTAQISGLSWHLTARLTRTGGDGVAGLDMSLDGQGPVLGLGAMFSGQIAADGSLFGRIGGSGPDLSRLLAAPPVPFKADGRLSIAAGLAVADELTAEIAGFPARGAVTLRLDATPRLDVSITASRLDLDAWMPAILRSSGKQIVASVPTGIDLSAEAATLAGGTLRALRGRFELDPTLVTMQDVAATLPGDAQLTLDGQVRRVALLGAATPARDIGLHFEGHGAIAAANLRTTLGWLEQSGFSQLKALPNDVLRTADLRAAITADTNPSGTVASAAPQVVLTELAGMVDQSHVQGSLIVRQASRLGVAGTLGLDRLALDPWLAGSAPLGPVGDLVGLPGRLGRFDLDLQVRAEQASFRGQTLSPFAFDAALETGRLTLRKLEAQGEGVKLVSSGVINDQGRIADGRLDFSAAPDSAAPLLALLMQQIPMARLPRGAFAVTLQAAGPPEALALRSVLDLGDLHAELQPIFDLPGHKWSSAVSLRHPGAPRLLDMLELGGTAAWLGDGSLSIAGNVAASGPFLAPTRITSDNFDVSAGQLRANGSLTLDRTGIPKLTGRVSAETWPLPLPYLRAPDALPIGLLAGWQATVKVEATHILAGLSPLVEQASAAISLNAGVLRLEGVSAKLENGALTGALTLDGETTPPRLSADLSVVGATPVGAVFELPLDLAGGIIDTHAALSASGYSAAALLSTLSGTFSLHATNGTLMGVDLARAGPRLDDPDLRAALAGGTTPFSTLQLNAALSNGAALISDTAFTASGGSGQLAGLLDIAGQTSELRLTWHPTVTDPPEIALRVSGPLASPNRTPELADAQRWRAAHP